MSPARQGFIIMKRKIAVSIITILIIGIVAAGLIDYYGKITGTIEVSGPVFYLDGSDNSLVNNLPETYTLDTNGNEETIFFSDSLFVTNFYDADYLIKVRSKSDTASKKLYSELWLADENNNLNELICSGETNIGTTGSWLSRDLSCQGNVLSLSLTDKFALKLYGDEGAIYSIQTGEYSGSSPSRIEISKT